MFRQQVGVGDCWSGEDQEEIAGILRFWQQSPLQWLYTPIRP